MTITPDLPDRIAFFANREARILGDPYRVVPLDHQCTLDDGIETRRIRTWFVGPDGLTEPERRLKNLGEVIDRLEQNDSITYAQWKWLTDILNGATP
jgi:hypothetical protein